MAVIAILTLALPGVPAPGDVEPAEQPGEAAWVVLDERPGHGEQCLVCRKRVFDEDVVEIRYRGRTFFVGRPFMDDFEADPARYFARLQANAALFDEGAVAQAGSMALGWLWFGVYVLAGLVGAAACGYLAVCRSLPPIPWFFAGLFGNVAAVVLVALVPRGDAAAWPAGIPPGLAKVPGTRAPAPCPSCGAANHPSASRCAACDATLAPTVEAETGPVAS